MVPATHPHTHILYTPTHADTLLRFPLVWLTSLSSHWVIGTSAPRDIAICFSPASQDSTRYVWTAWLRVRQSISAGIRQRLVRSLWKQSSLDAVKSTVFRAAFLLILHHCHGEHEGNRIPPKGFKYISCWPRSKYDHQTKRQIGKCWQAPSALLQPWDSNSLALFKHFASVKSL